MILWIIIAAVGFIIALIGMTITIKRKRKEGEPIDDEVGIEHITPWISN